LRTVRNWGPESRWFTTHWGNKNERKKTTNKKNCFLRILTHSEKRRAQVIYAGRPPEGRKLKKNLHVLGPQDSQQAGGGHPGRGASAVAMENSRSYRAEERLPFWVLQKKVIRSAKTNSVPGTRFLRERSPETSERRKGGDGSNRNRTEAQREVSQRWCPASAT